MQKRVLACLLASPLALNALAEVVVNDNLANGGTGWTQSGVTGEDPIFNQNGVNCPFTTGVITTQLADLNPGKYKITFGMENPERSDPVRQVLIDPLKLF